MKTNHTEALHHEIFKSISEVAHTLGYSTYVIGGYVRDYILHRNSSTDIDIVTLGDGISLAKAVSKKIETKPKVHVFKNFGTAMFKHQEIQIEFVSARKESYHRDSRKPIVQSGSLKDDQNRRDFTINALAISLNQSNYGSLSDPFGGIQDLRDGIIRTPLEPDITYSDDPLRMLRAARFASQLDFNIDNSSLKAIQSNKNRLEIISKERIVEELHKILLSPKPSIGFLLLYQSGVLKLILPELTALQGIDEIDGQRHKDNFYHTLEVVDNISQTNNNIWLRWAALLHDIGKAPTKRYDCQLGWTFHGHEFVGSKMVYKIFKRLKMPLNESMKFVQKMVLMSSRPIIIAEDSATDSAVRRLIFDAGEYIDSLITLCEADITTKNKVKRKQYQDNFRIVRRKIEIVEERDRVRNFQPPISGEVIMTTFGIAPCRHIGTIKDAIKDAILEGDIPNDYQAAYAYMLKQGNALGLIVAQNNHEAKQ